MVREGPGDRSKELFGLGISGYRAVGADDLEEQGRATQQGSEKDKRSPMIYLEVEPTGHSGSCFH